MNGPRATSALSPVYPKLRTCVGVAGRVSSVPKAAIRRTLCRALSGFCQGSRYVSDATDESLHYGAYHSIFQRDDPDGPWPNRKVDRQYFEWGSVGAKAQHGTG